MVALADGADVGDLVANAAGAYEALTADDLSGITDPRAVDFARELLAQVILVGDDDA